MKTTYLLLLVLLLAPLTLVQAQTTDQEYCHRCGMIVPIDGKEIVVQGVEGEPWYQCCPMCALMDIIESGGGTGTIKAPDSGSGEPITIIIKDKKLSAVQPASTLLLVGGSCLRNKIFTSKAAALTFVEATTWAEKKMIKPLDKVFANLQKKKKTLERCSICTTTMAGHEKTHFIIMTKDKQRMVACCGHCGLFALYRLGDRAKRATTTDFVSGKLIAADQAFYVVGNNLVTCCIPSTISFAKRQEAENFQAKHGGTIYSLTEALTNIDKVMKK